jgi:hypothetical protein
MDGASATGQDAQRSEAPAGLRAEAKELLENVPGVAVAIAVVALITAGLGFSLADE